MAVVAATRYCSIMLALVASLALVQLAEAAPAATIVIAAQTAPSTANIVVASFPISDPTTQPHAAKTSGLVDAKSVFFGCAIGATAGALVTALPPLIGWTFYVGAVPSFIAMVVTAGAGCSVGLFGGVILSALHWVFLKIGSAWNAVFG